MSKKTKDGEISDNFNPEKKGSLGVKELKKRLDELKGQVDLESAIEDEEKKSKKNPKKIEIEDTESTHQMLLDMRSVYKSAGGKAKLLRLIKDDDKLLMAMVKELLKIESSLLAAEIKTKEYNRGGNQVTFVILQGLQTAADVVKKSDGLDIDQIENALNPEAAPKIAYEEEIARPEEG